MRIGIDGSNLRGGGGVTHLVELLRHSEPARHGIEEITVWAGKSVLDQLPPKSWLRREHEPRLDGRLPARLYWQRVLLPKIARRQCDLLFAPGGSLASGFHPVVTMCRNMLPFQRREMNRYRYSWTYFRLLLLRYVQPSSFRRADGVIFLNDYAREVVSREVGAPRSWAVISHGVSDAFRRAPRPQRPLREYSFDAPFRFLYTSIIDMYKHQWNVAEAVLRMRESGMPVSIDFVGPAYGPALEQLKAVLARHNEQRNGVRLRGFVSHRDLASEFHNADAFVFASTCENMPNILIEAMAAGLPTASSNVRPMPDVLGNAGVYFNPEDATDIQRALVRLAEDDALRTEHANRAYERASLHSWTQCADATLAYLASIAERRQRQERAA